MKKTKMEKGITLVALIITIVVLLILAVVAISAIQNENILSHANNAAIKYNGSVDNEQGILGGYLDVLDKYSGEEWITIYEGNATTEDGMVVLGEGDLFAYGSAGVPYKITVSSDEYRGTVETVPILMMTENGANMYALFGVENGEAIGVTSLEDANNKISNLGENATMVAGVSDGVISGIMLQGAATCEYTITRIERKNQRVLNKYGFYYDTFYRFVSEEDGEEISLYFKNNNVIYLNGEYFLTEENSDGKLCFLFLNAGIPVEVIDANKICLGELHLESDFDYKIPAVKADNGIYTGVYYYAINTEDMNVTSEGATKVLSAYLCFADENSVHTKELYDTGISSSGSGSYDINDYEISNNGKTINGGPDVMGGIDIIYEIPEELYEFK